jgi:DNA repair exonuclease SbcCD nuclease subunit
LVNEVRLLHTSDIHIGAPFLFLGTRGQQHRANIRETFERIINIMRDGRYHVLIIAGDLFDKAEWVPESDLSFVIRSLAGLGETCHAVILPGSHDYWAPGTVYERERERFEAAGNVHIVRPDRRIIELPHLSLAVHGNALTSHAGDTSLLAELRPAAGYRWNVAVAHGSVAGASAAGEPEDHPIAVEELDASFDYIALGHWHSYNEVRKSAPPAIYSGAPELIARDQRGAGSVVAVTLSDTGAATVQVPVGRKRVARVSIDCTGITTTEELVRTIQKQVAPDMDLVLEISLKGVIGLEAAVDTAQAVEHLLDGFYSVRLAGAGPSREIAREVLLAVPEETVAGRFVRLMLERIENAPEGERGICEEALQIGYQLFRGRNPLE